ncbi:MAG: hypothetical protein GTO03_10490 [Planctomycetales bacterium]|nr:hypothetical protein [Planctomycetales bacterium]
MRACQFLCDSGKSGWVALGLALLLSFSGCGSSDEEDLPAGGVADAKAAGGDAPPAFDPESPLDLGPVPDQPPGDGQEGGAEAGAGAVDQPAGGEPDGEEEGPEAAGGAADEEQKPTAQQLQPLPPPEGARQVSEEHHLWYDTQRKQVIVDGTICLRRGVLELLACQQKTHEAVIQLKSPPSAVHALLLLAGAEPGAPAVFHPEYRPPRGSPILVQASFLDDQGQLRQVDARQFVRDMQSGQPLEYTWVFSGSRFEKGVDTGEEVYMADIYDDFICVSNFPTAMMDVPVESSDKKELLLYEAFTENIPPLGTQVRLTLTPQKAGP